MINNIVNSKFFAGLTATVAFTGVIANAGIANALIKTQTYTDTFDLATTDITDALLSIQKFDGSLGTLKNVTVGFDGQIVGDAKVESTDAEAQTLTFDLSGLLTLVESNNILDNPLFELEAKASDSFDASPDDGVLDFGGTSGKSFDGLIAAVSGEVDYTEQDILDFFTGNGDVEFLFSAETKSEVTGTANLFTGTTTQAAASVTVKYFYEKPERVPEPSTILGLGLFAGAGILSKKKLAKKA
ncbi:MAG: PEP-CTERM sorting domain-containing protein [Trichodesmium sp.]